MAGHPHRSLLKKLPRLLRSAETGINYAKRTAEEGLPVREIAELIGRYLDVPVVNKSPKEVAKHFSWLAPFLSVDNPVSSALTQERLG